MHGPVGEHPPPDGKLTALMTTTGPMAIACKQCGYLIHSPTCPTQNPQLHKRETAQPHSFMQSDGIVRNVPVSNKIDFGYGQTLQPQAVCCTAAAGGYPCDCATGRALAEAEDEAKYRARLMALALQRDKLQAHYQSMRATENVARFQHERVKQAAMEAGKRAMEMKLRGEPVTADTTAKLADEELMKLMGVGPQQAAYNGY